MKEPKEEMNEDLVLVKQEILHNLDHVEEFASFPGLEIVRKLKICKMRMKIDELEMRNR